MNLPAAVVADYTRLIQRTIRRYRAHPQYDDLLGFCYLRCFDSLAHLAAERQADSPGYVVQTAVWAMDAFFDSRHCDLAFRRVSERGHALPRPVSWELLEERPEYRERYRLPRPVEPDFAPALVERLWREQVWQEAWAALEPAERAIVRRWLGGESFARIGARRGWSGSKTQRWAQRGLNRIRRRVGAEPLCDGRCRSTGRRHHAQAAAALDQPGPDGRNGHGDPEAGASGAL